MRRSVMLMFLKLGPGVMGGLESRGYRRSAVGSVTARTNFRDLRPRRQAGTPVKARATGRYFSRMATMVAASALDKGGNGDR